MNTLFKLKLVKCIFSSTKLFFTATLNGILKNQIFLSPAVFIDYKNNNFHLPDVFVGTKKWNSAH